MRIATTMLGQGLAARLGRNLESLQRLQTQIATGQRIQSPSDDAAGVRRALELRSALRGYAQSGRNLTQARQWVTSTESALEGLIDMTAEARVVATRAADGSYGEAELEAFGGQIDGLLEEALAQGNHRQDGVYLFGGQASTTAPLSVTRDAEGRITEVRLTSAEAGVGDLQRSVGDQVLLTINTSGSDAWGGERELFAHLIALRDAMLAGDQARIGELMEGVEADQERLELAQATAGMLLQRLDGLQDQLATDELAAETSRAEEEDLDLTEALLRYQEEQTLLEAALSTANQLLELTLVRFLG